ncbi:MAG: TIGR02757 family protein [Deltaproteobacteria bacterium]|nr:TIGR02757 family protein [Deltaproteobacteria bacterium]
MSAYRGQVSRLKPSIGAPDDRPKKNPRVIRETYGAPASDAALKLELDTFLASRDRAEIVRSDPVELVRAFHDPHDQEVAGLLVATLAYGRVASIRAAAHRALFALGPSPASAVDRGEGAKLSGFVYRFQKGEDVPCLLRAIAIVRARRGSLANGLLAHDRGGPDYAEALDGLVEELRAAARHPSYGLEFLLPRVTNGAAKRLWLFLRWMIRAEDGIDLGTWRRFGSFDPARLLVPLDTHVERISRYIGLTDRKSGDLAMAREVTRSLARLRPDDPVAYDVALCHLGVSGSCPRRRDKVRCVGCPIRAICRLGEPETPRRSRR